jgi:hypothetical protein
LLLSLLSVVSAMMNDDDDASPTMAPYTVTME